MGTFIKIDPVTGEHLCYAHDVVIVPKRQTYNFPRWLVMPTVAMHELSTMKSNTELRILLRLISLLQPNNFLSIKQKDIALEMGISPANFSRTISALVKKGIVIRGPLGSMMINPHYAWMGSAKGCNKALAEMKLTVIQGGKTTSIG